MREDLFLWLDKWLAAGWFLIHTHTQTQGPTLETLEQGEAFFIILLLDAALGCCTKLSVFLCKSYLYVCTATTASVYSFPLPPK